MAAALAECGREPDPRSVRFITLVIAALLSVVGLAVSVPLAWGTERFLSSLPDAVPIGFTTGTYVTTCLTLLATAVIGALFSVRQVFKTDPIIALGQQQ